MKKNHCLFTFICCAFMLPTGLLHAAPVAVQTSTLDKSLRDDTKYGIGFTVSSAERPFIGVDNQDTSLIYLQFRLADFYIEGLDIGYQLYNAQGLSLDLLVTPRFYEVERAFAPNGELDGIDDTRQTYFAGLSLQYHTKPVTLTLQLLTDLLESDGSELVLTASHAFKPAAAFILAPAVGVTYQDAKLVDHFYGVQSHEVAAGRPAYGGHDAITYNVALSAFWQASEDILLLGQVKYEILGSGISDSPIIDNDDIITAVVGAVYQF